jgi:phosphoheptose isomerase
MLSTIQKEFESHLQTIKSVIGTMEKDIEQVSIIIIEALKNGNKILLCGNGGSAADAQHIAAESLNSEQRELLEKLQQSFGIESKPHEDQFSGLFDTVKGWFK